MFGYRYSDAKARYLDKIESIGGLNGGPDPFSSDFVGDKSDVVPLVIISALRSDAVTNRPCARAHT